MQLEQSVLFEHTWQPATEHGRATHDPFAAD